jgi:hypothetical protein
VSSNDITFIPYFVIIGPLVQKLKEGGQTYRQRNDPISLLISFQGRRGGKEKLILLFPGSCGARPVVVQLCVEGIFLKEIYT